jgi:hypothetical protein
MSTLLCLLPALLHAEPAVTPHGLHLEARTASVYAGACHYGGESVTAGREALVALRFDGGTIAGQDLAGGSIALVLAADANLEDEALMVRASVHVHAPRGESQAAALQLAARRHLGARTLELDGVATSTLAFAESGDEYSVSVPGVARLEAKAMPDRACCKMPQQVWYRPLGAVEGALVLLCAEFRVADGVVRFARHDENNGFVARFGAAAEVD